jgi:hypothetical protein
VLTPLQLGGLIGANPLGAVGVAFGLLGLGLLLFWTLQAVQSQAVSGADEIAEEVSASFADFVIAIAAVTITIGDQLIGLVAELVGMIDAPVVVGHVVGGILGWLGVQGTIGTEMFLIAFGAVTVVALLWRATTTRGRGL